ncbi:MAG: glycosyltransferase family 39 protein [Actinomycetota bacterium]|nr:glycosyltransferase family 39 protein [Actinomycetota bacterium]
MSQATLPGGPPEEVAPENRPAEQPVPARLRAPTPARRNPRVVLGLVGLTAVAVVLRLEGRGMSFWLDEGLSVGIASHPLSEIPGLLRLDGSPPLYYLVLHPWMQLFGTSEEAVRGLSLVLGLAAIPVAFWAGRSLFGRWVGWIAAVLAASNGYLVYYSREARMYTLLVLTTLVCVTAFTHAFVFGRRRWLPVFVLALAATLYTHNWGLYLAAGLAAAAGLCAVAADDRRRLLHDGALAAAALAVLYAPWVPTLVYQAAHTGAPWSARPDPGDLAGVLGSILGRNGVMVALALVGLPALVALGRRWRSGGEALAVAALAVALVTAMLVAWSSSLLEPAWAGRYFGVFLPPALLLAALGLAREGRRGVLALVVVAVLAAQPLTQLPGLGPPGLPQKSNVRRALALVEDLAGPGDLVISTQLEHVPLLRYYLGPSLRYADPTGPLEDPNVVDWRDATERLRAASVGTGLAPLIEDLDVGGHAFLVCPRTDTDEDSLVWFRLMERHCRSWRNALDDDPDLELVLGPVAPSPRGTPSTSIYVLVYQKRA